MKILILETLKYAYTAQSAKFLRLRCSPFSWINLITKFYRIQKISKKKRKEILALVIFEKLLKCIYHIPKVYKNCPCKTFLSTFLVLLFERACCSYMPLHFTIRQWEMILTSHLKLIDKNKHVFLGQQLEESRKVVEKLEKKALDRRH